MMNYCIILKINFMKRIALILALIYTLVSCKENDTIVEFDTAKSYIYFAYPNPNVRAPEKFIDSIYYSFALDEEIGIQQKILKIPVRIAGKSKAEDRKYTFVIDDKSVYDPNTISFSEPVIRANRVVDTLLIALKKSTALSLNEMRVVLNLLDDQEFGLGNEYNTRLELIYSDVLVEPTWWKSWVNYFGPFHKEVFQKWMQIYYLGADMSPHLTDGTPGPIYYWNNMPSSAMPSWYPITFMYIDVLKKYFNETVVYPNGDTTKDRILLPQ